MLITDVIRMKYKIGIIGCGLIGGKRAKALEKFKNSELILVADKDVKKAKELASIYHCKFAKNWKEIVNSSEINIVIVATTHDMLSEITISAIRNNKHVLVEKPAGRNPEEIKKIIDELEKNKNNDINNIKIKVGFNHRFHPAFQKAKEIIENEDVGDIMFITSKYGHGGRIGYDKEWRASKEISGGGELLDQGSHIIDLSRFFLGNLDAAIGCCNTFFWNMNVEDNCFALLRNKKGQTVQFHASWTQWKNTFWMEIMCEKAQLTINGLGGSYGKETLTFYKMKPEMGPPDKFVYEFEGLDESWEKEYTNLLESIENNIELEGNIYDAYESMKLVDKIYKWDKKNCNSGE